MIITILTLNLGELIYFPIVLAAGKVKVTYGISHCPLVASSGCLFISWPPKFRLRKVQAHLRKQVSRLESKTKPSGLKASSFSRRCALPAASPVAQWVKNPLAMWAPGFDPQVGKIPWRRAWQAAPVFLPGDSHGQRSLGGCSPWGPRVGHD